CPSRSNALRRVTRGAARSRSPTARQSLVMRSAAGAPRSVGRRLAQRSHSASSRSVASGDRRTTLRLLASPTATVSAEASSQAAASEPHGTRYGISNTKRASPQPAAAASALPDSAATVPIRSEEHTSELQSRENLVCRLLLEKKNNTYKKEKIK